MPPPSHQPRRALRARQLRFTQTEGERALWRVLRDRSLEGHKFRRQRPVGRYIVDFVCLEQRIVVEVDGAHHLAQAAYDAVRDEYLRGARFRVLRFTNREVLTELEAVVAVIWDALRAGGWRTP